MNDSDNLLLPRPFRPLASPPKLVVVRSAYSCFFPWHFALEGGPNRSSRTDMHSGNLLQFRKHSGRVSDSRHPGLFRFS
jgi:hypothetical protein